MAIHVAPGSYSEIIDKSQYVEMLPTTIGLFVFASEQGVDNELIYTTSQTLLDYGLPNMKKYGQALLNLHQFMGESGACWTMRVLPTPEMDPDYTTTFNATVDSSDKKTITLEDDKTNKIKQNDIIYVHGSINAGRKVASSTYDSSSNKTTVVLNDDAGELDESITINIPDYYYPAKYAHVIFAYAAYEDPSTSLTKYAHIPIYLNKDTSNISNVFDEINQNYYITKFATQEFVLSDDSVVKHNAYGVIENSITISSDKQNALNNDSQLKSNWLPTTVPSDISECDVDDSIKNYYKSGFIFGSKLTPYMVVFGKGRGSFYNNISIRFKRDPFDDDVYILEVLKTTPSGVATVEEFKVSFIPDKTDPSGENIFIENVVKKYSKYIDVLVNHDVIEHMLTTVAPIDPTKPDEGKNILDTLFERTWFWPLKTGESYTRITVPLKYGSDGKLFTTTGQLDQNVYATCLQYAFNGTLDRKILNVEETDFSLVYDANFPISVKQAIVSLCKKRRDCVAILDLPLATRTYDAVKTAQSKMAWLNTMYAAVYVPFSTINEDYTNAIRKVAPSYHMAYIIPRVDKTRNIWDAPAGLQKAVVDKANNLLFNASMEEDLQILVINRLNPIIKKHGTFVVWGNRTSLKTASALGDLNVVRTILYIDRNLKRFTDSFIFENNTPSTWMTIKDAINEFLSDLKARGALYNYSVEVGATEYEIKRHKIHVNVRLKPVRAVEIITLTYTIK